ncbi:ice-binding family protein [Streptomyces tibetensis]|uniref:ice-binding family protein n=1 Tax=Streptomyces tibetensis TaxID=2382123 RepID=UPI0033D33B8D
MSPTRAEAVATAVPLGTAGNFGVLAGSTVTNTGPTTVERNVGVAPGSAIVGFPPGAVLPPGTIHAGDAEALQAQNDLTTAYNQAAGQAPDVTYTGNPVELGGQTLVPGVYKVPVSAPRSPAPSPSTARATPTPSGCSRSARR